MPQQDTIIQNVPDTSSTLTILPKIEKVDPREAAKKLENYFEGKLVWSDHSMGVRIDRSTSYWQFSILLSVLILFVIVRIGYINRYRQLLEAFFSIRYMKQVIREELALSHPFSLFLLFNFSICTGLLVYFLLNHFGITLFNFSGFSLFIGLSASILVLLFIKTMVLDLIQFLLGEDGGQTENRYTFLIFYQVLGIAFLPIVVLASFGPENLHFPIIIFGLFLLGLIYVIRLGRSVFVGFNNGTSVFYLFLYLCALELAPLIVWIKMLIREIG